MGLMDDYNNNLEAIQTKLESDWEQHKQLMISTLGVYYREGPTDNYNALCGMLSLLENDFNTLTNSSLQELLCWLNVVEYTLINVGAHNDTDNMDILNNCKNKVTTLIQKILPKIILSYNIQSDMLDEYDSPMYFPINTFTTELANGGFLIINTDSYGKIKISGHMMCDDEAKNKLLNLRTIIPQDTWDKIRNNNRED